MTEEIAVDEVELELSADKEKSAKEAKKKKWFGKFEIVIAIMLAITTLATAWASWISGLHGSDMSSNYALAARQTAEASSEYNAADQLWLASYDTWDYAYEKYKEIEYYELEGETDIAAYERAALDEYLDVNCKDYPEFKTVIMEALEKGNGASPFDTITKESFFTEANAKFDTASETRAAADWNNLCADCFGLVQVLYSIVLFLLGIVGVYREPRARQIIFIVAMVLFVAASIYMLTLPLPKTFNFFNYFSVIQSW